MTDDDPFRVLSDKDFLQLSSKERMDYIRRAITALERLKEQIREQADEPDKH